MTYLFKICAGALALTALSACDDMDGASGSAGSGMMAPSPAGPPFVTTYDASVSDAAVASCRDELSAQTDGAVDVVGSEFSEANSAIYMRVGANGAPWRCLVANDGTGPSLMSMADEGAL